MKKLQMTLLLTVVFLGNASLAQTYERTRKNFLVTAEVGSSSLNTQFLKGFTIGTPIGGSVGVGKYLAFRKVGVLPVSVRAQYSYDQIQYALPGETFLVFASQSLSIPVQWDIFIGSMKLSKSKHYECRYLNNKVNLALLPGWSWTDTPSISGGFRLPMEVAYSFNVSKSGGHKSVQSKDLYFTIFMRSDLNKSLQLSQQLGSEKVRMHTVGLRFQYTHFKTYKFSDM